MQLPVLPPVAPMLAKLVRELPTSADLVYEPKWDGFRTIVFFDGTELELASRNERSLTRYFPELDAPLRAALGARCVLDGEIVIAGPRGLDFDALSNRIHPAESRIRRLSTETPAELVAFDLLSLGDEDLRPLPFATRRARLAELLAAAPSPTHLTPQTPDPVLAAQWLSRFEGAGLDGVVAKSTTLEYREGERVMFKVKHERSADCVIGGFRWHAAGHVVGSLLLGLYDEAGVLHHVGVASGFTAKRRAELVDELTPYCAAPEEAHPWRGEIEESAAQRRPGAPSRWNSGRDTAFEPLRPELVCEVSYGQLQGDRFRHATSFRRFRPDRAPSSCTYGQLETIVPVELREALGGTTAEA
jgi:ATP-dependent DNA ligase